LGYEGEEESNEEIFACSDFLVADESAVVCSLQATLFEEIDASKRKGYTLMVGLKSKVSGISVSPIVQDSMMAVAGSEGYVILWDYNDKVDMQSNFTEYTTGKSVFTVCEFTRDGHELLVATTTGEIKIMDTNR